MPFTDNAFIYTYRYLIPVLHLYTTLYHIYFFPHNYFRPAKAEVNEDVHYLSYAGIKFYLINICITN